MQFVSVIYFNTLKISLICEITCSLEKYQTFNHFIPSNWSKLHKQKK